MESLSDGAQAPNGKSRPITRYSMSAIVSRSADYASVDPEFDDDTFIRAPGGDALAAVSAGRIGRSFQA